MAQRCHARPSRPSERGILRYVGQMVNDEMTGHGHATYDDGGTYEGDGEPHNYGALTYFDGRCRTGEMCRGHVTLVALKVPAIKADGPAGTAGSAIHTFASTILAGKLTFVA